MVQTSRPLSQFQYLSLSLTTVLSFLGVWRQLFRFTDNMIEKAVRKCKGKRVGKKANKAGYDDTRARSADAYKQEVRQISQWNDNPIVIAKAQAVEMTGKKKGDSGAELEAKGDDGNAASAVELQAVNVRNMKSERFDDERSPVDGDDARRTARLEKRVDEAKVREDEMKACVDAAVTRAAEAELVAQQLSSRMLEMERKLNMNA